MPTMTWPAPLPQRVLVEGFTEKPPVYVIRSQPKTGPAILRRFTSGAIRPLTCSVPLLMWQVELLDQFFVDDLAGGLWPFRFPHPRLDDVTIATIDGQEITIGTTVIVRMVEPPSYTATGPVTFEAALNLEIMP